MSGRDARAAKRRKAFGRRIGKMFACGAMRVYERLSRSFFTAEYLRFASAPYEQVPSGASEGNSAWNRANTELPPA